jgi:aspartate-semialdehyde dehydrogenase
VNVEFERPISVDEAREILSDAEGIVMYDEPKDGGYCTPIECAGEDGVFVSRLRLDPTVKHGLSMWIVSDNLRKGAALNAVQIAEELIQNYGLAPKKAH